MTRTIAHLFVLKLVLCGGIVSAFDPVPIVDANLTTEGEIWQGQRVVISLILKTPDTFASAPAFDLPQISGMILVPPEGSPVLGTETLGDDTFTTQTHELNLFPQQAGQAKVRPFTVRFDSSVGFGKPVHERTVTTSEISFAVKRPPGTEQQATVLTTTDLKVTETWQPEPTSEPVSTGSTFVRMVQIQATNLAGMVLPSFRINAPAGIHVYDQHPSLNDQSQRGDLTGSRTETSTIVCEKPGTYSLPAMTLKWWNPKDQKLEEVSLPAREITVINTSENAQSDESPHPAATLPSSKPRWPIVIAGFVLLLAAGFIVSKPGRNWMQAQRLGVAHAEQEDFANVVRAFHTDDAKAIYCAIQSWRGKIDAVSGSQTISSFSRFDDDSQLMREYELLDTALYGSATSKTVDWSATRLLTCLTQFRTQWKRGRTLSAHQDALPEMNSTI